MELTEYRFPAGAVVCEPGDYLFRDDPEGEPGLLRVEDVVLIRKLYPMQGAGEPTYFEAESVTDSVGPHYPDEIHLLLTSVDNAEPPPAPVAEAQALTVTASPIVRAASAMPSARWRNLGRSAELPGG